jgi:hypothetical protein
MRLCQGDGKPGKRTQSVEAYQSGSESQLRIPRSERSIISKGCRKNVKLRKDSRGEVDTGGLQVAGAKREHVRIGLTAQKGSSSRYK